MGKLLIATTVTALTGLVLLNAGCTGEEAHIQPLGNPGIGDYLIIPTPETTHSLSEEEIIGLYDQVPDYDADHGYTALLIGSDARVYEGASHIEVDPSQPIIVLVESETGRNEIFYDITKQKVLNRIELVSLIREGSYPAYTVKIINGVETPVSKPDGYEAGNLG